MGEVLGEQEPQAWADFDRAAERAGVEVRLVRDIRGLEEVRRVCDTVWPTVGGGTQVTANLLRAMEHAGGYVVAAYDSRGEAVGAAIGFLGRTRSGPAEPWEYYLHSHMAAVLPAWRDRRVGTALKLHQRWWALDQGLPVVAWTFDPLVRRNARVNLVLLGAEVVAYLPDFYGDMDDEVNVGDRTDRLLAWWRVASPRACAAARGDLRPEDDAALLAAGAMPAVRVSGTRPDAVGVAASGEVVLVALPDDIVRLRIAHPDQAVAWRMAVRTALQDALASGWRVAGFTAAGAYVLRAR